MNHTTWFYVMVAAICALTIETASAQPTSIYPARAVRVIVPYPPGGSLDLIGSVYARALSDSLGQPFVVDNRGGAARWLHAGGDIEFQSHHQSEPVPQDAV